MNASASDTSVTAQGGLNKYDYAIYLSRGPPLREGLTAIMRNKRCQKRDFKIRNYQEHSQSLAIAVSADCDNALIGIVDTVAESHPSFPSEQRISPFFFPPAPRLNTHSVAQRAVVARGGSARGMLLLIPLLKRKLPSKTNPGAAAIRSPPGEQRTNCLPPAAPRASPPFSPQRGCVE